MFDSPFGFGFDMFSIMGLIFPVFFLLIFGVIIFTFIKGLSQWNKNNKEPVLNVDAVVVSKRTNTSHSSHANNNMHSSSSTSYFVTFQVQSGDRIEFHVSGSEYGMIAEGDRGNLVFQGSRFHGFDREI